MLSRSLIHRNTTANSVWIPAGNTNSCASKKKAEVSRRPISRLCPMSEARVAWASYFGSRVGNYTIFGCVIGHNVPRLVLIGGRCKRQRTRQLSNKPLLIACVRFLRTFIRCVKRRSLICAVDIGGSVRPCIFKVGLAVPVQAPSAAFISLFLY